MHDGLGQEVGQKDQTSLNSGVGGCRLWPTMRRGPDWWVLACAKAHVYAIGLEICSCPGLLRHSIAGEKGSHIHQWRPIIILSALALACSANICLCLCNLLPSGLLW